MTKIFFSEFTNKYSLSKTLRFELRPVGKTLEHIELKGLIVEDEKRAEDYKIVKKIIDEYHKFFIDFALDDCKLDGLDSLEILYSKFDKDDKEKKDYEDIQTYLRKQIAQEFKGNVNGSDKQKEIAARYSNLFKAELIKNDLIEIVEQEEDKKTVECFKNFTTYFTGFHENRKNMYVDEAKSTAIAYRLINENLPTFFDNIHVFNKILKSSIDLSKVTEGLTSYLNGFDINALFSVDYYRNCLTQQGIEKYNILIGGISQEGKNKIQGLNECINLYNQKVDKKEKLPRFKQLYKQILSDKSSSSFVIDEFETDNELLETLQKFYSDVISNTVQDGFTLSLFEVIETLLKELINYDLSTIFLKNDTSLTNISANLYGDWNIISSALNDYYDNNFVDKGKKCTKKDEDKKVAWLKKSQSVQTIQNALNNYDNEAIKSVKDNSLINYFLNFQKDEAGCNIFDRIKLNYQKIKDLLNTQYPINKKLSADNEAKSNIKEFLDSVVELVHFIKPFELSQKDVEKDLQFYSVFDEAYKQLDQTTGLYNKARNYLTKKPYSTEKIKLNFENSTLLAGWDLNKETDNTSIILRKDGLYYLGIMDKKHNKIFKDYKGNPETKTNEFYEKMNYKLLPGPNKMLPKVFFSNSRIEEFGPSKEIMDSYANETHKKGANFIINDCYRLIDFFKASLKKHGDWKNFNFIFSETNQYNDLSDFYKEVATQGYKITFQKIDNSYINALVAEGKLYLFQIYNKDFSEFSKGKPNLHTTYWKMLFDEKNLADVVYKLNGEAEVFYRKKSLSMGDTAIHKSNESINNKSPINGKKQSIFDYDIIKNKRFTMDKFQFHVPITLNFKADGSDRINSEVNQYLKDNPAVNIIGLDRGERHLIYLTLINQKGEILIQESLNSVLGVNYHEKLDKVEKNREQERKNWEEIENIKELKSGYLSQVVHKIAKMMVEYNAIIVMEDLNFGFKRGRIKVEKQVYQKFEKALIDKLNYLVFKDKDIQVPAGFLKALQLTNKFDSFKKLGKQSGFVYYVSADYTSKIDPVTGFVNLLYPKYESVEKSQNYFNKFNSIAYNKSKDYFEFGFDYRKFNKEADYSRTEWIIVSKGERLVNFRNSRKNNKWDTEDFELTEKIKSLFKDNGIDFLSGNNLIKEIVSSNSKELFKPLTFYLKLILQMRNSRTGTEEDYLLSPVADENGKFFDSRKVDDSLPKDADANGAYHIALKGLLVLNKINQAEDINKVDMKISNKEWFNFVQTRNR